MYYQYLSEKCFQLGKSVFVGLTVTAMSLVCLLHVAHADDSPFGYIYTADLLPKGQWEYEQWNTIRTGKASGSYTSFDLSNEIEYGVSDSFSSAFYLHSSYLSTRDVPSLNNQSSFDINGISLEFKKRLLSPYKDPIGLVLYLEPEMGIRSRSSGQDEVERALEFKVIVQKNFLNDQLVLASNIVFEPEWAREDGEREKELKTEYSLGASYRFSKAWMGGLELLNRRKYGDQNFAKEDASAYFFGPSVHYANKSWWSTLTVLPQIGGVPHDLGTDQNGNAVSDSFRTLGEYERTEIRLRFGINFL